MSEEDDVRRAIKLLEGVMRVEGVSKRGMDERLGKAPGYVAQVLSGRLELKFRHVLAILYALEIEPRVFFRALYPDPGEADGSVRMIGRYFDELQRGSAVAPPEPPSPVLRGDELERRIREAVEAVLDERERRRHGRSAARRRRTEPAPAAADSDAADSDDPEPVGQLALA
jgi:hypothetical protein